MGTSCEQPTAFSETRMMLYGNTDATFLPDKHSSTAKSLIGALAAKGMFDVIIDTPNFPNRLSLGM